MDIKRALSKEEVNEEFSHLRKVRPIVKPFVRENYDIVLEEIDWASYKPGNFVSKYA